MGFSYKSLQGISTLICQIIAWREFKNNLRLAQVAGFHRKYEIAKLCANCDYYTMFAAMNPCPHIEK